MVWHTLVLVSNHVWLLERNRSKSLDHGPAWTSSMLKLHLVHFGLFLNIAIIVKIVKVVGGGEGE